MLHTVFVTCSSELSAYSETFPSNSSLWSMPSLKYLVIQLLSSLSSMMILWFGHSVVLVNCQCSILYNIFLKFSIWSDPSFSLFFFYKSSGCGCMRSFLKVLHQPWSIIQYHINFCMALWNWKSYLLTCDFFPSLCLKMSQMSLNLCAA